MMTVPLTGLYPQMFIVCFIYIKTRIGANNTSQGYDELKLQY